MEKQYKAKLLKHMEETGTFYIKCKECKRTIGLLDAVIGNYRKYELYSACDYCCPYCGEALLNYIAPVVGALEKAKKAFKEHCGE